MSRWKPPHPSKTIHPVNEHAPTITPPVKWSSACCWPKCRNTTRNYADIPMCPDHLNHVTRLTAERRKAEGDAILSTLEDAAHGDSREVRNRAQSTGRLPRDCTPREGVVYYVRVGQHIKIGYSKDLNRRMRAYPPDSTVLGVEIGDTELERQRHARFEHHRALGREWFIDCPDIREFIDANCLAWSPRHKPAIGPAGPPRAQIRRRYRGEASGTCVA